MMKRKKILSGLLMVVALIGITACFNKNDPSSIGDSSVSTEGDTQMGVSVTLTIKNEEFALNLEENEATRALVEKLRERPLAISFDDYGGFEKVGSLGFSLPRNDSSMTTYPGDVVLYNGNNIVIFYGSNSWSYTKLGHIDDVDRLTNALSGDNVNISFTAK